MPKKVQLVRHVPLLLSALLVACKPPPDDRHHMPGASAERGRKAIERVGCGSCHVIPGIRWPKGRVGPTLGGLPQQALIAGKLPNRPDVLARFVSDAPSLVPGINMPAMPLSGEEARDIAAYLYQMDER